MYWSVGEGSIQVKKTLAADHSIRGALGTFVQEDSCFSDKNFITLIPVVQSGFGKGRPAG